MRRAGRVTPGRTSQTLAIAALQLRILLRKRVLLALISVWMIRVVLVVELGRSGIRGLPLLIPSLIMADLLVIAMTCGLIADDADHGTFAFVLSHGIERRTFLLGKLLPVVAVALAFSVSAHVATLAMMHAAAPVDAAAASGLILASIFVGAIPDRTESRVHLAIETERLCKTYRDVIAVEDLTLQIPAGSLFGLMGRNGAGKTTTLNLLTGLLRPNAGSARIEGRDAHREGALARRAIAFVPEDAALYPWLTVEESARYWSRLCHTWNESAFRQCIRRFNLPSNRVVSRLSKGMRTALLLALAAGKEPNVYILDEPTSGLDPAARRQMLRWLDSETRQKGRTVLLSSHVLSELNETCTHVAILDRGRLKVQSALQPLRDQWRRYEFHCRNRGLDRLLRDLDLDNIRRHGDVYTLFVGRDHERTRAGLHALSVDDVRVTEMQLEEIFFSIIGGEPTSGEEGTPGQSTWQ